tara:strand:- start:1317 stop:2129 length:813 start_codon:yes stop_codon:yes gene_type:complete
MYYLINNKFFSSEKSQIPFDDSGFLFGDGLFETMRFDNKKIFSSKKHLDRLKTGLKLINLNLPYSKNELNKMLNKVIKKNKINNGLLKLIITRGLESENYKKPNVYISIKKLYAIPKNPVKVVYFKESNYPIIRYKPAIKSINYIGNMLAKRHATELGFYEPVFYNSDNLVTECAIRNIFYIKNNILITPSLDLGILSGVMRETIIDITKYLNIDIHQTHINFNDINSMDEAFISSTGIGLLPCYWGNWDSNFKVTKLIKKELYKRIKNN